MVPTARVWGKRHVFIIATALLMGSSIWAGYSKSYGSLQGARILQGFAVCPFEALLGATVGDLYPVHVGNRNCYTMVELLMLDSNAVFVWHWPTYRYTVALSSRPL